jgi:lysophospholipase L1-like esterase
MRLYLSLIGIFVTGSISLAEEKPLAQDWDYAAAMKKVAAASKARPGVVLHIGDSITYSNPYGQWARNGQGKTDADKAVLNWMHAGKDDDTDGWYLARFDHPDGGRSYTACSGIRTEEMLAGGKQKMPPLEKILDQYKPQIVVFMLGTNDASANRKLAAFQADYLKSIDLMLSRGIIPIVSTIPPHIQRKELAASYSEAIRKIAKDKALPLIDFEKEILTRRPDDWNGTLLNKNDVHPTGASGNINSASAPTAENLKSCGYLLRGWLSVKKIAEVKTKVLDDLPKRPSPSQNPAPKGKPIQLPVTRDNWVSNVGSEIDGNNGGASRIKVKSHQEMSIFDIDTVGLKGRVIVGATLHLKMASDQPLRRATVSSVGAEWVEGTGSSYTAERGSSTFKHRQHPNVPWTIPGSDLCSVIFGQGGTIWRMADATAPDGEGWQKLAIDPSIVMARLAGISQGFLLFDDTGSEWTRQGEKFTIYHFPNRFFHSRESGPKNAPYVVVFVGENDETAPERVTEIRAESEGMPAGEAVVSWATPPDAGSGAIGFFVKVDGGDVPRYLIPAAGKAGERVAMHLRDLNLKAGSKMTVEIRAVDGAGNIGATVSETISVAAPVIKPIPPSTLKPFTEAGNLPLLGKAEIAIIDELDKVHPENGSMIPKQSDRYRAANHLWSAKENKIQLQAAKNEFVAFQILFHGPVSALKPSLKFKNAAGVEVAFGEYHNVNTGKGPLPDPILPLKESFQVAGQKYGSLHCEIYVPHEMQAGDYSGSLILQQEEAKVEIPVSLKVWDFTLPDHLSFLPEMNGYGLPASELGYFRLAHRHRTVVNIVPYSQSGNLTAGWGPSWDGKQFDWTKFDKRFGPYFDGSAFADLPRKGVPLDAFYLPLHENWPTPVEGNYNGDYWADRAFPATYRDTFVEAARQFAKHFNEKRWDQTLFQGFLNNKQDFKQQGWSRGSAPWILDEPSNFQDFWALRYFALAFHEGIQKSPGKAKVVFRADISRPMWQRDSLDGLLDYLVVSGEFRKYHRMVLDRKAKDGQIVLEYGNSNAVEDANIQPAGWCIDTWCLGGNGVVPWLAIGTSSAWEKGESTCLFYPARSRGQVEPIPSIRLKAYRRGQQDVEYLTLYAQTMKEPNWAVGQKVRESLKLAGVRKGTGFTGAEDAGILTYQQLLPQDLWALRIRVAEALSTAKPPAQRQLIDFRTPPRHPEKIEDRQVRSGES